jgi:hypothetical protein
MASVNKRKRSSETVMVILLVVTVAAMAYPRFDRQDIGPISKYTGKIDGHTSFGDAVYYMNYVDYFRGEKPLDTVDLPFRYRPLIPLIASILPVSSPLTSIDIVNLAALYLTQLLIFALLKRMGFKFGMAILGCFLYTISFPVFYMSTTGYLEACAMCLLTAGALFSIRGNWMLLAATIAVGMFVKENVALLVPVGFASLVARRHSKSSIATWTIVFFASYFIPSQVIRQVFGDFHWVMRLQSIQDNLRLRALLSVMLSFGITGVGGILFLINIRQNAKSIPGEFMWPIVTGLAFTLLLLLYSMLTAYTDGRFIWPAAVFTIPMTLWVITSYRDRDKPVSRMYAQK